MLFQGDEDIASFEAAIAAEDERRYAASASPRAARRCSASSTATSPATPTSSSATSTSSVPTGCASCSTTTSSPTPPRAYRRVLEFLDVDPDHRPDFDVVNANKVVRSTQLRRLLRHAPPGLRRLGRLVVPDEHARAALRRRLHGLNTRGQARPPMPVELRRRLVEEFAPEIRRLEAPARPGPGRVGRRRQQRSGGGPRRQPGGAASDRAGPVADAGRRRPRHAPQRHLGREPDPQPARRRGRSRRATS